MFSHSFLQQAYSALGHLALPAILARLALKGWKSPEYYQRVGERLGLGGHGSQVGSIWVHAVSVGEIQAASALLQKLLLRYPRPGILLTTTTPTGSKLAQEKFADQVSHCYLPYDLPWAARKFLEAHRPQLALFMETEIWPNMFAQCHKKGIPLMLLNARISRASWRGYSKVKPLIQASLNSCQRILAQSKNDAHRLKDLGAVSDRVLVSGNLKFDVNVPQKQLQSGKQLRQENWPGRPVWIAASTHAGEEEKILQAQAEIASCLPGSLLILVPRHPQRFDQVHELCRRQGFAICRRSKHDQQAGNCSVYLADSLGELFTLYAAADVAFVGGSLVDKGGHNLLEPAAIGLPLLSGPNLHNFHDISERLLKNKALKLTTSAQELAKEVVCLVQDHELAREYGKNALQVVQENQGALNYTLQQIDEVLGLDYKDLSCQSLGLQSLPKF